MPGNTVNILITAKDDASRVLAAIRGNAQGMAKDIDASAASFDKAFSAARVGAAVASTAILAAAGASVKLASDLNEARNASEQTFKDDAGEIEAFAAKQAAAFNITKTAAFEYSAALGGIFKASGLSTDAAATMSVQMVKLAADLSSLKNLSIDEALTKIRSGLVGEAEPLRTVGVLLSEAAVKSQAAKMGFTEVNGALTEGQKVQARAAIITAQLADAQGDVARTSGALANQLRNVKQETEDLGAKLGQAFIPAVEKGLQVVSALLNVLNAIPTPILATATVVVGATTALAGFSVAATVAWKQLQQLAAAYLNVSRAAGIATAAQAAQTVATAASGAAAAGRAVGGVGQVGVILGQGARTRFVGNASMQAIQAQRFAPSAAAAGAAAGGGTFAVLTRAAAQLALRINPLTFGFGILATAATAAAFTMQEFAKQSRERSKDTVARTTGQFAGEVATARTTAADTAIPVRQRVDDIKKQIENLQQARAGLQRGVEQSGPSALGVTGAASATKEIADLDAAIRILTGDLANIEGPVLKAAAAFAKTEEEALAGGRGVDIGGTADEIAKKFWETFKTRMADSADKEAQAAMASQRDAINNAIIDTFKQSGQKAAEAFKSSMTPDLMDRVNRRAAELARTLGIDLVNAMGLAMAEVGSFQAELNRAAGAQAAKQQELRDLFSNEGDELRGGLGDLGSTMGGITKKGEMEAAQPGQTQLNKIPVLKRDAEGRVIQNLPTPTGLNPIVPAGVATGIDAINQLKQTTQFPAAAFEPVSGGGSKADPLADAIQSIRDRFNQDLAKALVSGGERAFNDLAAQQADIRAEISRTADDLMGKLGIKLPEALTLAADAVIGAFDAIKSAVDSTKQKFTADLAEAFYKGGGSIEAYNEKLAEQGPLLAKIAQTSQQFMDVLGLKPAEAYQRATEIVVGANEAMQSALDGTKQRFKTDLADAFVKNKGGLDAYNKTLAQQGPILEKIDQTAQQFQGVFGVQFPEAYELATNAVLKEVDRLKAARQNDLQGFLGKLAARRSAIGLNAVEGFNVRPPTFDVGGIVPGPRGAAVMVKAHAGETILPTHRQGLQESLQKVLGKGAQVAASAAQGIGRGAQAAAAATSNVFHGNSDNSVQRTIQTLVTQAGALQSDLAVVAGEAFPAKLPEFDLGGVIPGPKGSPQVVLGHAGETVLPTHKQSVASAVRSLVPPSRISAPQVFSPTFAPSFSPSVTGGSSRSVDVTINRSIGVLNIASGVSQEEVVKGVEATDQPLLRQVRQTFAEAR